MRVHLALAGLVLAIALAAAIWFRPGNSASSDPASLRDSIAAGPVVVEISPNGLADSSAPIDLVVLPGVGWVWNQRAEAGGLQPGQVIATPDAAVSNVATNCYAAVVLPALPGIPGVTLARHLDSTPDLSERGDVYRYSVSPTPGTPGAAYDVTEDLSGIARSGAYSATVSTNDSDGITGDYTIRKASAAERAAAAKLIASAHASAWTVITFDVQTMLSDGTQRGSYSAEYTVLRDCPSKPIQAANLTPAPLAEASAFPFFTRASFTLQVDATSVSALAVAPLASFNDVPRSRSAGGPGPANVRLRPGAIFAQLTSASTIGGGASSTIFRVHNCAPTSWFPCPP